MILTMNDPSSSMICLLMLHDVTYDCAMLPIDFGDVTKLFFGMLPMAYGFMDVTMCDMCFWDCDR